MPYPSLLLEIFLLSFRGPYLTSQVLPSSGRYPGMQESRRSLSAWIGEKEIAESLSAINLREIITVSHTSCLKKKEDIIFSLQ